MLTALVTFGGTLRAKTNIFVISKLGGPSLSTSSSSSSSAAYRQHAAFEDGVAHFGEPQVEGAAAGAREQVVDPAPDVERI